MRHNWGVLAIVVLAACGASTAPGGTGPGDPGATDGDAANGDASNPTPSDGDGLCPAAIADIKTGVIAASTTVCLQGVVVTAIGADGVFVATPDATSNGGIYLSRATGARSLTEIVDTSLARISTAAGETQLVSPVITVSGGTDATSPVVTSVTELGDDASQSAALEAMLVFIPTVTVTATAHSSFTVSDDDGTHTLLVGGFLSPTVLNVQVGDMFDAITGIWRATPRGYELEPRGDFDLQRAF